MATHAKPARRKMPFLLISLLSVLVLVGCAALAPSPPQNQGNICEIFREHPDWYDYALNAQEKWGTPIATQMSFIQQESSFRSHVRPPRQGKRFFIFPGPRPSSALGYTQALDPVWGEYRDQAGGTFARRTHMVMQFCVFGDAVSGGYQVYRAIAMIMQCHESRRCVRTGRHFAYIGGINAQGVSVSVGS